MKEKFKLLYSDKTYRILFILTLLGILGQIVLLVVNYKELPPEMPLFYSLYWGKGQLAPTFYIFIIPLITAIFLVLNSLLSILVFGLDLFWKRILAFTSFVLGMLTTYWIYKTVSIFI